jgi:hypothetical protein
MLYVRCCLIYSATLTGTAAPQAQNIWEIQAAAIYGLLIHSIRIEFVPTLIPGSGVDSNVFANICLAPLLTTGSGGIPIVAAAGHPRNTLAAKTFFAGLVSAPGTTGPALISHNKSIIYPLEFFPLGELGRGIEVAAGTAMAVSLTTSLQAAYTVSSTIIFEEF